MEAFCTFGTDDGGCRDGFPAFLTDWFVGVFLTVGWPLVPGFFGWIWVVDAALPFRFGVVFADERAFGLAMAFSLTAFAGAL